MKKQGKLEEKEAREIFNLICEGVFYLHSMDIAHRDINPSNILLSGRKSIKLCDFNWASKGTDTICLSGTLEYLAPEQVNEQSSSKPSDIWALGVLLYEMVHGKLPFVKENKEESYLDNILTKQIIYGEISESLNDLLESCLVKDEKERLDIEDVMNHKWLERAKVRVYRKCNTTKMTPIKPVKQEEFKKEVVAEEDSSADDEEEAEKEQVKRRLFRLNSAINSRRVNRLMELDWDTLEEKGKPVINRRQDKGKTQQKKAAAQVAWKILDEAAMKRKENDDIGEEDFWKKVGNFLFPF